MKSAHIVRSSFSLRGWAIFSPSPPYGPATITRVFTDKIVAKMCQRARNINVNFQLSPMKGNKYKTGGAYAKAGYKNLA